MNREDVPDAAAEFLRDLADPEKGLDDDSLRFAMIQFASLLSARRIQRHLVEKDLEHLLVKTPVVEIARKVSERLYDLHSCPDFLKWLAAIDIMTLRDVFEENGLPRPENPI